MTPFRRLAFGAAALLLLASAPAEAAWNNVFQVNCCHCRERSSYYTAPATVPVVAHAAPACGCCQTCYVQRCYYQPVTTYKTVCEPVTSYRTSYYYEPVCTYRTSCYYDPCTCQSIQVTTPVTSYRLRSKCNAVTSYVQKCVPVTTYRPTFYMEAVTSCAPGVNATPGGVVPRLGEGADGRIAPQNVPMNPANIDESGAGFGAPGSLKRYEPRSTPAPMKLDHVVSRPSGAAVNGQVVANNFVTPLRGAQLVFVSRQSPDARQVVTADRTGRFSVTLASGGWNIYMPRNDGALDFHSSIDIAESRSRQVMVVSR
ncbi:MAG: hypothetical protein ACJ8F7_13175 [Gemmataceae bacterium]